MIDVSQIYDKDGSIMVYSPVPYIPYYDTPVTMFDDYQMLYMIL